MENGNMQIICNEIKKLVKSNTDGVLPYDLYSRNADMEIKGVPIQPQETLIRLLGKLCEPTNEPIAAADVEVCHHVPVVSIPSGKNMIVQFTHRARRNSILENARRLCLTTTDLGLQAQVPVYVNEHLCPKLKKVASTSISEVERIGMEIRVDTRRADIFAKRGRHVLSEDQLLR